MNLWESNHKNDDAGHTNMLYAHKVHVHVHVDVHVRFVVLIIHMQYSVFMYTVFFMGVI